MLKLKSKKYIFTLNSYWFSKKPGWNKALTFSIFKQCQFNKRQPLFLKKVFNTIHIDLKRDDSIIKSEFTKTTQYEIRRAERDGVECYSNITTEDFVNFFNIFAHSKSRSKIKTSDITLFGKNILITGAFHQNTALVMHCYILDNEGKRLRLLHSASEFRNLANSDQKNLVGRANRLLHYYDICEAKKIGMETYDLGGYSIADIDNEKKKINEFKKSFGGNVVEEPDYISFPLYLILLILNKI